MLNEGQNVEGGFNRGGDEEIEAEGPCSMLSEHGSQNEDPNEGGATEGEPLVDIDFGTLTPTEVKVLQFRSADCAYAFYNEYGRVNGFGIRRSKVGRNKLREIIWVRYICNKAGFRDPRLREKVNRQRQHRALSRCGCCAQLRVRLDSETGLWFVDNFYDDHNHQLMGKKCMGLARSHRKMTDADIAQLNSMRKSGISTSEIFGYFAVQSGGINNVGFRKREPYNQIVKQRAMYKSEFNEALKYLAKLQSVDPAFYWKHLMLDDGSLLYLFWCDGCSQVDYKVFGDVLAFDATYGKNKYKLPLIIFSGVNHHKQTCVFASAIVANESEETYVWVLRKFLEAMQGKCPSTVITDGDVAIRNAILIVFPEAHHRLCAWHLLRNATANIKKPYFTQQFKKCMLHDYEICEFEERWTKLIEECGLQENQWAADLYAKKMMWSTAHIRGKFFAGLRTTSRCEGLHGIIGRYVKKGYNFVEFIEQFERCIEHVRNNEIEADYKSQNTEPVMQTEFIQLEKCAADVYTREIFEVFRTVLVKSATVKLLEVIESPSAKIYIMGKYFTPNVKWRVCYYQQADEFRCSCRRMESIGIPCSHIIKVLIEEDIEELPGSLVLERWTKGVKEGLGEKFGEAGSAVDAMLQLMKYGSLVHDCREMCRWACYSNEDVVEIRGVIQKEKCRLKQKHAHRVLQNGMDEHPIPGVVFRRAVGRQPSTNRVTRRVHTCRACHKQGHNRATCAEVIKQNMQNHGVDGSSLSVGQEGNEESDGLSEDMDGHDHEE